jgi:hypothetical protein
MSRALSVLLSVFLSASVASALAQDAQGPAPAAPGADSPLRVPRLTLPNGTEVKLPLPRAVRAAETLLGMSRQRLALVVGIGRYGNEPALPSAQRDAQAVASALRGAGFVVMAREDLGTDALRADLAEFRQRLQPGGIGFVYVGSLGTRLEGRNLLLTRASRLDADAPRALDGLLPLQEVIDAVQGPVENPRYLVVDAAYAHPGLAQRAPAPFAEPKIPPGVMALFSATPGSTLEVPAVDAPPPAVADAQAVAVSRFAKAVVATLNVRRLSGAATLRAVRSRVLDQSQGRQAPWISGDSDDRDDLTLPDLVEAALPRSPEELAREAARQIGRRGEPTAAGAAPAPAPVPAAPPGNAAQPDTGGPTKAFQAAATTAGTFGNVATAAAGTAATMKTTQAVVAAEAAGAAAGGALQVAGSVAQAAVSALTPAAPRPATRIDAGGDRPVSDFLPPPPPAAPPAPAPVPLPPANERAAVPADFNGRDLPATPLPRAPKRNAYGYAQGDSFTYRTLDVWKDRVTGSYTQRIDNVFDDGVLNVNQAEQRLDAQGRTIRRRNPDGTWSSFDPVQEFWWSNPKRGESRDVRFDETIERGGGRSSLVEWKGSMEVGRLRRIQLPAGEFEVLPIEGSGWLYERGAGSGPMPSRRWWRTVWYSPQLGHPVAIDIEETDALNKLLRRERIELTHAETSRNR